MQEPLHIREYTRELKKQLPAHVFQPSRVRLLWMIPHVLIIGGAIAAIGMVQMHWLLMLGLSFVIGHSFACLGFLAHEISHGSVVRTPWLRQWLAGICFAPFLLAPWVWKKWHNVEHHGHTQAKGQDPDAMATLEDYRERPALQVFYKVAPVLRSFITFVALTFWFTMHCVIMYIRFIPEAKPRDRWVITAQLLMPLAALVALFAWIGPVGFLFAYAIPLLVGNAVIMSYIATNHLLNPLSEVNDPLATSLTVTTPRIVDWLHLQFSYHTEHHIFPHMNPKFAPLVKEKLLELWPDRYHALPHWQALLLLWKTPRLYHNDDTLVDPERALVYPVLGTGLSPHNTQPRRESSDETSS